MQQLNHLRMAANLTADQLSKAANVGTNHIYVLERRPTVQDSVQLMLRLATALASRLERPVHEVFYEICADAPLSPAPEQNTCPV
ncbi:helix-turn-helix domain-containing protein [Deinococcus misasensis]|uniref:helix-turn-helix domain-containing protein n=1 Tax=Deinococcus misasensis TaxID=392413 RepID=UPI0005574727|nr:helix-turn-helix domain-containing protein [Deinococcus misasensis]